MTDSTKILNNLRRQCSRREYCTCDVLKKALKALEGDREEAQKILNTLIEERYVDDLRYAEAFERLKFENDKEILISVKEFMDENIF